MEEVLKIWKKCFKVENINLSDNFFELGGSSIKALLFIIEINKTFKINLSIIDLFENYTFNSIYELISKKSTTSFNLEIDVLKNSNTNLYNLSTFQLKIWVLSQNPNLSIAYNNTIVFEIKGSLDIEKFNFAFNKLLERQTSLRTIFPLENGIPKQSILQIHEMPKTYNFITYESQNNNLVNQYITNCINRLYNFEIEPPHGLFLIETIKDETYSLIFSIHHIIEDGDSLGIFFRELLSLYHRNEVFPEILEYKDFSSWHNEQLLNDFFLKSQKEYWNKKLNNFESSSLPYDYMYPIYRSHDGRSLSRNYGAKLLNSLKNIARSNNTTLFNLFFTAFLILIKKMYQQDDVIVGVPSSGRNRADTQSTIGMFVNTLPIRSTASNKMSFKDMLSITKEDLIFAIKNQDYPLEQIIDNTHSQTFSHKNALFDTLFVWNEGFNEDLDSENIKWKKRNVNRQKCIIDLMFLFNEEKNHLDCSIEYSTELFKNTTIESIANSFDEIIKQIVNKNGEINSIDDLNFVSTENLQLINEFNRRFPIESNNFTIKELFEKTALEMQNKFAVCYDLESITYSELDKKSNQLAQNILSNCQYNDLVGVMMNSSIDLIVTIIAIIKAGKVYTPILTSFPLERKKEIITNSDIKLIITNQEIEIENVKIINFNYQNCEYSSFSQPSTNIPDSPLYVIHTSGTTGRPKGVIVKHRNIVNLIQHQKKNTSIDFEKVLQFASVGFDVSIQEILSTLVLGGTLIIIKDETKYDIIKLFNELRHKDVTTIFLPTSYFTSIFNSILENEIMEFPSSVKHIVVAGEKLVISNKIRELIARFDLSLHNHYGPSETHVVTEITYTKDTYIPDIPSIGKPICNTAIYILDNNMKPVPIGIPGNIFIGGDQVGLGYLNYNKLTEEKFIDNPFLDENSTIRKSKMYDTGDIGKWNSDGTIEYIARKDLQVKIRGFRVELNEIKNLLLTSNLISDCIVLYNKDNNPFISVYYISDNKQIDENILRSYVITRLPDYMIPRYFIQIEKIPLTVNGKLDIKKLNEYLLINDNPTHEPLTETEHRLIKCWSFIFTTDGISQQSNFFEIGGHSIKAIQLISIIRNEFDITVTIKNIFEMPTVKEFSEYLDNLMGVFAMLPNNSNSIII